MSRSISLEITFPDGKTLTKQFDGDTVLIGSGPSAVLKLEDPEVSSIHAVIKAQGEDVVTIVDLGSDAGTKVNGTPVTEPVSLKSGDVLSLGRVQATIRFGESAKSPAPEEPKAAEPRTSKPPVRLSKPPVRLSKPPEDKAAKPKSVPPPAKEAPRPAVGARVVRADDDLDAAVLATPLEESNRPTAEQHALEISVIWGTAVLDTVQVKAPRDVTVSGFGKNTKGDLRVDTSLPVADFTIAHNRGQEAEIVVPSDAKVGVRTKDGSVSRSVSLSGTDAPFPAKAYRLAFGERLAFKVGTLTFVAQYVRGDAQLGKGGSVDWFFPRIFTIVALLHVFFVFAAFITPRISESLADDLFKNRSAFGSFILKQKEKEKRKPLDLSGKKGGAKAKDEEGKFGKKDKPKEDKLASKAGAPKVDPNKREKDRKIAMNAGLLGILKSGEKSAVSNVFGPGGLGTGINSSLGGIRGSEMGDAGGAGGLGSRGSGAGGGGNALGIGGLGTHGHGTGTGGYGNIDLGGRGKGTTRIVPGKTIIQGSLSKEEIGRVIRRNLARFKYCYEKELNATPTLAGKVGVYFTIAPTGSVAEASVRETSINNNNVEECVLRVMRSLKFPQPKGGGIVVVTYPFVFASA
ncbi:MAG: AgmX/PglI C-terminal domain-containing protein [Deltaproteobacteria bacterium]|nr:AgmX/PglI C-terminal domain-containing protein [Deltaproteobacteria bacterium]